MALYESTGGAEWDRGDNWLVGPLGTWFGVSVDDEGRVTRVSLPQNGLNGAIPAALGDLTELEVLSLQSNKLSGQIPAEIWALPNLGRLTLFLNDLSGRLPREVGDLTQLRSLGLGENRLDGPIPDEIGRLKDLRQLDLNGNQFSGRLPSEIGGMSSLESLVIDGNPLSGPIPLSLTALAELRTFDFSDTGLCTPRDSEFGAWLEGVGTVRGTGVVCNAAPDAAADDAATDEDEPVVISVLANDDDDDGDELRVADVDSPEHGAATTDGFSVTYTPLPDFFGDDEFSYAVTDGEATATAVVRVTVRPVNDPPAGPVLTEPADGAALDLDGDPAAPVVVQWSRSVDPEGDPVRYRWELATTATFSTVLFSVETEGLEVSIPVGEFADALAAEGVGAGDVLVARHRVTATDGEASETGPSASLQIVRGVITGTEGGPPVPYGVTVSPNPASWETGVTVSMRGSGSVEVVLFDVLGRRVSVLHDGDVRGGPLLVPLDTAGLPPGQYIVRATTGREVRTARLAVVR